MDIICTICSKNKDTRKEPLQAYKRYKNKRINKVREIAIENNSPFYILSGKYGLISELTLVNYYDQLLTENLIESVIHKVCEQIKTNGIKKISFYIENKPSWRNYIKTLETACKETGTTLAMVNLG